MGPTPGVLQPPDFYLVQKNSLKAISIISNVRPQVLATLSGEEADIEMGKSITEYVVKAGDTLSSIAQQFNISLTTLLGTNNLTSSSPIASGKKLVILPVSGVMYLVKAGDTLGEVARKYKGDLTEVIAFNELTDENDIFVGDIVIIPNGVLPPPPVKRPAETLAPLASGYFVCPITGPCRVTQRLHWYNAVDLSHGSCGEPVYAAASGKVQKVKLTSSASRWTFGGAGNHLTILHPNGVVTFYGHLASALVSPGQEVTQGQTIALMGGAWGMAGSGNSTGCHLHFQVTGAKNPFNP